MTNLEAVVLVIGAEDSGDVDAKRAVRGLADPAVRAMVERVLAARAEHEEQRKAVQS